MDHPSKLVTVSEEALAAFYPWETEGQRGRGLCPGTHSS